MKKVLFSALSVALGACVLASTAHAGDVQSAGGRYVVVFKSGTLPADAGKRIAASGGQVARAFNPVGVAIARGNAAFAERMKRDNSVLAVGPEQVFAKPDVAVERLPADAAAQAAPTAQDDLYFRYQWDMRRIGAPAVWTRSPLSANAPRVAVLDTGVMHTHPDLAGQVDASVSTTYCNTAGAGGAGYPAYSTLIDFDAHPNWSPADGCTPATTVYESHGTHVAGTIAAKLGGGRVVGVAPDALVGAYKVFDRYRYTDAEGDVVDDVGAFDGPVFDAIMHATRAGYPVISMSLGGHVMRNDKDGNASWLAWDRVAKWANRNGALIVASAGNSTLNLNGALAHFPSDLSTVLSTSATGSGGLSMVNGAITSTGGDVLAAYSNFGSSVDIAAPGGDCGPDPETCVGQYLIANTGISAAGTATYLLMAGTSMATPHVSAVAAQVRAQHPDWTPGAVRSWLKDTAQNVGSRQAFGAGMVDADAATR